jgi:hypothetical protein
MAIDCAPEDISRERTKSSMGIGRERFIQSHWRINSLKASYQHFWATGLLVLAIATFVVVPCNGLPVQPGNETTDTIRERPGNATTVLGKPRIHPIFNPKQETKAAYAYNPISYRIGGAVLTGSTKVYIMYYGTWSSTQKNIVQTFISTLSSTAWFNIEKTYYYQPTRTGAKTYISGPLTLGATWNEGYSVGSSLRGAVVPNLISTRITNGQLPKDPHGIYLFLSSYDVSESSTASGGSFCAQYCGYHYHFTIASVAYFYGFIGNPKRCLSGCAGKNVYASPTGDVGTDGMLSVIAHELVEAMSDPLGNAWGDSSGEENADKCAFTYGNYYRLSNGAYYNMYAGGRYYLIQQNWNAKLQTCAMSA